MGLEDDDLEPLRGPLRALAMQKKLDAVAAGLASMCQACLLLGTGSLICVSQSLALSVPAVPLRGLPRELAVRKRTG